MTFRLRSLTAAVVLGGLVLLPAACSMYRNDRAWVPPEQYSYARDLFVETGSLDLVRQRITTLQWERPIINETLYRLQKEFEVLPEDPLTAKSDAAAQPAATPAAAK